MVHGRKHPSHENLLFLIDAMDVNMNGPLGMLLSVLSRKICYAFVLSHAGAENHSGYNWSKGWSGLSGSGSSCNCGKQENKKDYKEADGNDEHTVTTRLYYRLLCVWCGAAEMCVWGRETIRDFKRAKWCCFSPHVLSVHIRPLQSRHLNG